VVGTGKLVSGKWSVVRQGLLPCLPRLRIESMSKALLQIESISTLKYPSERVPDVARRTLKLISLTLISVDIWGVCDLASCDYESSSVRLGKRYPSVLKVSHSVRLGLLRLEPIDSLNGCSSKLYLVSLPSVLFALGVSSLPYNPQIITRKTAIADSETMK
jgi:hypothetical protein